MGTLINISEMNPGDRAVIKSIQSKGSMRRRLLDIGLVENTKIECVGKSPGKDPLAYYIRGAVIAIRSEDGKNIIAKRCGRRKEK